MKNCYVYDLNGYIEYYTHFSQIFELCSPKNSKEMDLVNIITSSNTESNQRSKIRW